MRSDAVRNREAILCAAAATFASSGTAAPLDEVARMAGVGIATLYRRFPDRDSLIEAVFDERMVRYADHAEIAAARALTDPWGALEAHVHYIVDEQTDDPGFSDVLIAPLSGSDLFERHHARTLEATRLLVRRVRDAGVVRPDFHLSDLYLLSLGNFGLLRATPNARKDASRRLAAYLLEGFRNTTGNPLPPPPAAWQWPSHE